MAGICTGMIVLVSTGQELSLMPSCQPFGRFEKVASLQEANPDEGLSGARDTENAAAGVGAVSSTAFGTASEADAADLLHGRTCKRGCFLGANGRKLSWRSSHSRDVSASKNSRI